MVNTIDPSNWPVLFEDTFQTLDIQDRWQTNGAKWTAGLSAVQDFGQASFAGTPVADGVMYLDANGLVIEARKSPQGSHPWHSGLLQTVDQNRNGFAMTQGYIEAEIKMSDGLGTWPAFWMLQQDLDQTPYALEFDILEFYPRRSDHIELTSIAHNWPGPEPYPFPSHQRINVPLADFTTKFNTFGTFWDAEKQIYFINREEVLRITDVSAIQGHPMYPILNLAFENITPAELDAIPEPQRMHIRRVTAWDLPQPIRGITDQTYRRLVVLDENLQKIGPNGMGSTGPTALLEAQYSVNEDTDLSGI